MYLNIPIVYTLALKWSLCRYFVAKVHTVRVHGPLGVKLEENNDIPKHHLEQSTVSLSECILVASPLSKGGCMVFLWGRPSLGIKGVWRLMMLLHGYFHYVLEGDIEIIGRFYKVNQTPKVTACPRGLKGLDFRSWGSTGLLVSSSWA